MNHRPTRRSAIAAVLLTFASTAFGQYSLHFGAPGAAVRITDARLPEDATRLTVTFWMKTSARIRTPIHLVSIWPPATRPDATQSGTFYVDLTSTRLGFGVRDRAGRIESVFGRAPARDGRWHHVAASFDGARLALFVDGKLVGEEYATDFGPLAATELPMIIGPVPIKTERRPPVFDGFLSDVTLWSKALDVGAIQAEMRAPSERDPNRVTHCSLRATAPGHTVDGGALSESLARTGWCYTAPRDRTLTVAPTPDLFCYDMHVDPNPVALGEKSRAILVGHEKHGKPGVIWQSPESGSIQISWIEPPPGCPKTIPLAADPDSILAAATTDPAGNVYYLVFPSGKRDRPETEALGGMLHKADASGAALLSRAIDTSRAVFNVWSHSPRERASLRHHKGVLGLILPRTMYRSSDGLRHQGAIAVTFSAKNLHVMRMLGTTSSHSKGNILTVNSKGQFVGLDLGDNYPRGLHLHQFTRTNKASRVIFTFKTAHGTRAFRSSPVYDEISGDVKTFYKWSNDNNTYTELGGVIDVRKGYLVVFSTDLSPDGKVLDNSRAFRRCPDPRNLALLRIARSFQKGSRGSEVPDSIMVGISKGSRAETGGFFNFVGRWTKQRVTGVHWLTRYATGEAARTPQITRLPDGRNLILWEKTDPNGSALQLMTLDKNGKVLSGPTALPLSLALNREDRLLTLGDRVYFLATGRVDKRTRLYSFRDDSR